MQTENYYNIIVAGGGPAGCAAAIAAKRQNPEADVLIVEYTTSLGGMSTAGMVSRMTRYTDGEKNIYNGLACEIMSRYKEKAGIKADFWNKIPLFTETLKNVFDQMITEEKIEVLFGAMVVDAETENDHIKRISVAQKEGIAYYTADVFIDCTGDGDLAYHCGVPFEKGSEKGSLQPCSLCFSISGVHYENLREEMMNVPFGPEALEKEESKLLVPAPEGLPNIQVLNGGKNTLWSVAEKDERWPLVSHHFVPIIEGDGTIYANGGHVFDVDTTDAFSLSKAYILGRETAAQYLQALKTYLPKTFKYAAVAATAPLMGVRESRRFEAQYKLTVDDYFNKASFPDDICRNHNWIDCHTGPGEKNPYKGKLEKGETHGIPFRCLVPKKVDNLLLAGRCISLDRAVFSSVRVMPNCFQTGEAAGIGAAMAVKTKTAVQQIDGKDVRKAMGI